MNKVLYIFPNAPLADNYSGAATRYLQNFLALKDLGLELHVLRFDIKGHLQKTLSFEQSSEMAQLCHRYATSWMEVNIPINKSKPIEKWSGLFRTFADPIEIGFPKYKFLGQEIQTRLETIQPDLLWAEKSFAAAAVWNIRSQLPNVYSHHDFQYLINSIRKNNSGLYQTIYNLVNRYAETRVSCNASFVITGSTTERQRLKEIGCRSVSVIPMINNDFPALDQNFSPAPDIRLIHLGSLETTANRNGLISYLSRTHQVVLEQVQALSVNLDLIIVGDATRVKAPLNKLLLQPHLICTGYVADLGTVLRPYDISILPYTEDSGYRTKLPLLMGYAQVVIATRAALAGSLLPGLEHVCIVLNHIEDFPEKIVWLATHPDERKRLGLAARAFAEQYFSLEAVRPLYADSIRPFSLTPAH